MKSKTRLTLDLKNSESYDNLILHRGDSNSRVIEIELTDDHAPVKLTSAMSATINASTNGIVVADGEKATVDTANNIISFTVTDNMTSLPGQSKISLTVTEGDALITAQTFRATITDSVINEGSKFEPTGGTVKQFMDEIKAARGDYDNLNARFDSKLDNTAGSVTTDNIASMAVTSDKIANGAITATKIKKNAVSGSNIAQNQVGTNHLQSGAVTKEKLADEVKTSINTKADKATTIAGYGITNAYTKAEIDETLSGKLNSTAGSVTTDNIASKAVTSEKIANGAITALKIDKGAVSGSNIADNQIGTNHLQNGAVTIDKLADEVNTIINSKYDAENVETGIATLAPYSSCESYIKAATCEYTKIGKRIICNLKVKLNAFTLSKNASISFTNLPFITNMSNITYSVAVTSKGNIRCGTTASSNWVTIANNTTSNIDFEDNDTIDCTLIYNTK